MDRIEKTIQKIKQSRDLNEFDVDIELKKDVTYGSFITELIKFLEKKNINTEGKTYNKIYVVNFKIDGKFNKDLQIVNQHYNVFIQVFEYRTLIYDITEHFLVPKHVRISSKNVAKINSILEKYHVNKKDKLMKISVNDPMAKYIGLMVGDVVEIERVNSKSHRVCI